MATGDGIALVELDHNGVDRAFRADVLAGLAQAQKAVPARWLYDDAGSELFETITRLPEYYPTRAETEILTARGEEFRELIGPGRAVVEFGSGSSVKTPLLLGAIEPAAYVPLDISGDFLRAAAADLSAKFPGLPVHPVEADFMRQVELPEAVDGLPKLGFFPGSTIGNMVARTAVDLLRSMRATLGQDSKLLIGMDLIKDPAVLEAAYDDAQGSRPSSTSISRGGSTASSAARSRSTSCDMSPAGTILTPGWRCISRRRSQSPSRYPDGISPWPVARRSTRRTATSSTGAASTPCSSPEAGRRWPAGSTRRSASP
jgi:hypothetical protein